MSFILCIAWQRYEKGLRTKSFLPIIPFVSLYVKERCTRAVLLGGDGASFCCLCGVAGGVIHHRLIQSVARVAIDGAACDAPAVGVDGSVG